MDILLAAPDEKGRHTRPLVLASFDIATDQEKPDAQDSRGHVTARWGVPTPSGHTYVLPTTVDQARNRVMDFAQGGIEGWDADEGVPEPTWEVVSVLLEEIERLKMLPALVAKDYRDAREALDPDCPLDFYRGALDAIDEVGRRIMEQDRG